MHFEVLHCHARAGCVQFAGAVAATDSREILVLKFLAGGGVGVRDGGQGFGVDSGVAHDAFKGVVWIGAVKLSEAQN